MSLSAEALDGVGVPGRRRRPPRPADGPADDGARSPRPLSPAPAPPAGTAVSPVPAQFPQDPLDIAVTCLATALDLALHRADFWRLSIRRRAIAGTTPSRTAPSASCAITTARRVRPIAGSTQAYRDARRLTLNHQRLSGHDPPRLGSTAPPAGADPAGSRLQPPSGRSPSSSFLPPHLFLLSCRWSPGPCSHPRRRPPALRTARVAPGPAVDAASQRGAARAARGWAWRAFRRLRRHRVPDRTRRPDREVEPAAAIPRFFLVPCRGPPAPAYALSFSSVLRLPLVLP